MPNISSRIRKHTTAFGVIYLLPPRGAPQMGEPLSAEEIERFDRSEEAISRLIWPEIMAWCDRVAEGGDACVSPLTI